MCSSPLDRGHRGDSGTMGSLRSWSSACENHSVGVSDGQPAIQSGVDIQTKCGIKLIRSPVFIISLLGYRREPTGNYGCVTYGNPEDSTFRPDVENKRGRSGSRDDFITIELPA